jgi:hypothetical protein
LAEPIGHLAEAAPQNRPWGAEWGAAWTGGRPRARRMPRQNESGPTRVARQAVSGAG